MQHIIYSAGLTCDSRISAVNVVKPPTSAVNRRVKDRLNTGQMVPLYQLLSAGADSEEIANEDDQPPMHYLASLICTIIHHPSSHRRHVFSQIS